MLSDAELIELANSNLAAIDKLHDQASIAGVVIYDRERVRLWIENAHGNAMYWLPRNLSPKEANDLLYFYYQNPACKWPLK